MLRIGCGFSYPNFLFELIFLIFFSLSFCYLFNSILLLITLLPVCLEIQSGLELDGVAHIFAIFLRICYDYDSFLSARRERKKREFSRKP